MPFREHGLMLYLDKQLLIAFNKLKADKTLGRSFAGLLALVEGLHSMRYLSDRQYKRYKKRYSVPLDAEPEQVRLEEAEELQEERRLNKTFRDVREQWHLHEDDGGWCEMWIRRARKHAANIPEAKQLLSFVEGEKVKT